MNAGAGSNVACLVNLVKTQRRYGDCPTATYPVTAAVAVVVVISVSAIVAATLAVTTRTDKNSYELQLTTYPAVDC